MVSDESNSPQQTEPTPQQLADNECVAEYDSAIERNSATFVQLSEVTFYSQPQWAADEVTRLVNERYVAPITKAFEVTSGGILKMLIAARSSLGSRSRVASRHSVFASLGVASATSCRRSTMSSSRRTFRSSRCLTSATACSRTALPISRERACGCAPSPSTRCWGTCSSSWTSVRSPARRGHPNRRPAVD